MSSPETFRGECYAGLDVSLKSVSICVCAGDGEVVWRGEMMDEPSAMASALSQRAPDMIRTVLETGSCGVQQETGRIPDDDVGRQGRGPRPLESGRLSRGTGPARPPWSRHTRRRPSITETRARRDERRRIYPPQSRGGGPPLPRRRNRPARPWRNSTACGTKSATPPSERWA